MERRPESETRWADHGANHVLDGGMNDTTALTPKTRVGEYPHVTISSPVDPHGGTFRWGRRTSMTINCPTRQCRQREGVGGRAGRSGTATTGMEAAVPLDSGALSNARA